MTKPRNPRQKHGPKCTCAECKPVASARQQQADRIDVMAEVGAFVRPDGSVPPVPTEGVPGWRNASAVPPELNEAGAGLSGLANAMEQVAGAVPRGAEPLPPTAAQVVEALVRGNREPARNAEGLPVAPAERPFTRGPGRPTSYTEELADEIVERLTDGQPMAQILRLPHMPAVSTEWAWEKAHPEFSERVAHARTHGADAIAVDALQIADTPAVGEVVKVERQAIPWTAEERAQEKENPGSVAVRYEEVVVERRREDMTAHRRLQVETRLKLLACWDPRYSSRVHVEGGALDALAEGLRLARERASAPPPDQD